VTASHNTWLPGNWHCPRARSDTMVNIQDAVYGVICPWSNNKDGISWQLSSSSSVESLWDHIREKQARVDWYKLVWGSLHIPRHSFIAWLALLNRLTTKTRQLRTGRSISNPWYVSSKSRKQRFSLVLLSKRYGGIFYWYVVFDRPVGDWVIDLDFTKRNLQNEVLLLLS